MKLYRNTIYIFLLISLLSLLPVFYLREGSLSSNISLAIFGSSLVTLFSACIAYHCKKKEIFQTLGLNCVEIYGILWHLVFIIKNSNKNRLDLLSFHKIITCIQRSAKLLEAAKLSFLLQEFSGVLSSNFCIKFHENKEIKLISSLYSVDSNLILPLSKFSSQLTIFEWEVTKEQNTEKQKEKLSVFEKEIENLIKISEKQLSFLDQQIEILFKHSNFALSWEKVKTEIESKNSL